MERPTQMNVQDQLKILIRHFFQGSAANDSGVVNQDVDPAPGIQRRSDNRFATLRRGYRLGARDRLATRCFDRPHDFFRGTGIVAFTLEAGSGIIDNDFGAPGGEQQGIGAAEPTATAGDDGYTIVESEF
jgi:hypothetical protein